VQVRNLSSAIKVAVDFVSPHAIACVRHLAQEMRAERDPHLTKESVYKSDDLSNEERLQAEQVLVYSARELYKRAFQKT
jgi:hypothetical protein